MTNTEKRKKELLKLMTEKAGVDHEAFLKALKELKQLNGVKE